MGRAFRALTARLASRIVQLVKALQPIHSGVDPDTTHGLGVQMLVHVPIDWIVCPPPDFDPFAKWGPYR